MENRISRLESQVYLLKAVVVVLVAIVGIFCLTAAEAPGPLKVTDITVVDDAGRETGRWTKDGLHTNVLSAGASSPSTAMWDKNGIRTTRIIVVNQDGQERGRWDTSGNGTSELGLENAQGQAMIQIGVT